MNFCSPFPVSSPLTFTGGGARPKWRRGGAVASSRGERFNGKDDAMSETDGLYLELARLEGRIKAAEDRLDLHIHLIRDWEDKTRQALKDVDKRLDALSTYQPPPRPVGTQEDTSERPS